MNPAADTGLWPVLRLLLKSRNGPQGRGYKSRQDWRPMVLANPSLLRLRLEKQRAKPVPA